MNGETLTLAFGEPLARDRGSYQPVGRHLAMVTTAEREGGTLPIAAAATVGLGAWRVAVRHPGIVRPTAIAPGKSPVATAAAIRGSARRGGKLNVAHRRETLIARQVF